MSDPTPPRANDPALSYEPPAHPYPPAQPYPAHPSQPSYPSQPARPYAPVGVVSAEDRNWALAAHLSSFVAAYLALGFLGPLVVLLTAGQRSPFVRRHATEALNFNLTVLIAVIVSAVLVVVLIGIPMLIIVGLGYLIATISGAAAASRGQDFRYPLTIRFVR